MTTVTIDPANAEQLRAWDGDEGAYWAAHAEYFDRSVRPHHATLMAAAAIGSDERVLDIGCGTGQTTRDAARAAPAGSALGVDLSSAMLDHARRRAADEGLGNVSFQQADAQVHPFTEHGFDIGISRTGAMFFADLGAAFANLHRALRPAGRLALVTWQGPAHNEWFRSFTGALAAGRDLPAPPPDAPTPFALADPERIRAVLGGAGFERVEIDAATLPMWFGNDGADAHGFVLGLLGWMLEGVDDDTRHRALDGLRSTTDAHETPDGVLYESGIWTITATRR